MSKPRDEFYDEAAILGEDSDRPMPMLRQAVRWVRPVEEPQ